MKPIQHTFRFEPRSEVFSDYRGAVHERAPLTAADARDVAKVFEAVETLERKLAAGTWRRHRYGVAREPARPPWPDSRGPKVRRWSYGRPSRPFAGWTHEQAQADEYALTCGEPLASLIRNTPRHYQMIAEQEAMSPIPEERFL